MNIWIVYSPSGWHVYDFVGKFLGIHSFMCDSKGHAMRLGVPYRIISDRSWFCDLSAYYLATGSKYEYSERQSSCDQWWYD